MFHGYIGLHNDVVDASALRSIITSHCWHIHTRQRPCLDRPTCRTYHESVWKSCWRYLMFAKAIRSHYLTRTNSWFYRNYVKDMTIGASTFVMHNLVIVLGHQIYFIWKQNMITKRSQILKLYQTSIAKKEALYNSADLTNPIAIHSESLLAL